MEDQTVKNPDKGGVQSVARIFELIEVLAAHPAGASLQRLAEDAHLAKSTTHRLLGSLVSLGYAAQDSETGKYRLTLKMFEISSGIVNSMDVMSVAKVHLERLAQRTGEAVHLVIRDAQDIVYIYKTESGPMRMSSRVGLRSPLYCTGVGKAILATLPADTLVYLWGQAYIDGTAWDSAQALALDISGFLPDNVLRRISAEEAAPYLAAIRPQVTPTVQPTAQPAPFSGYAVTRGSNVMIRNGADDKAQIAQVLGEGEVVYVIGQEYVPGYDYFWEVVRFGNIYGYVRSDQLRRMGAEEQAQYEAGLRTPTPAPVPTVTPPPVNQGSTSSYGYVTTNNVRLRSGENLGLKSIADVAALIRADAEEPFKQGGMRYSFA